MQDQLRGVWKLGDSYRELSEVDRTSCPEDGGDCCQEQQRRHQRYHDIGDSRTDPAYRTPEGNEHEAGDQQNLKPDVEVKEVAGDESVIDTRREHEVGGIENRDRGLFVAVGRTLTD